MNVRAHRRAFLKTVGLGLAALPMYRLLENSFVQAAGASLPLKFVGIYHPHGVAAEYWALRAGETEDDFDITYENCSLQPFDDPETYGASFKDRLLVIEGIELFSNANGHETCGTILTGSRIEGGKKPQNISLDQYLAVDLGMGAETRLTSIALGVGVDALDSGVTLSFGPGGEPLPKIIDPVKAYETLFAGFVVGTDPAALAEAERQRQLGRSIIDFVRDDVGLLRTRVGVEEKLKLDQHLTSLRELEKQFDDLQAGSCSPPAAPDASSFPALRQYNGGEPYFDAITNAHIDLLAQALACDITRFATLFTHDLSYAGNPLGLPTDNHGAVAHTYNASTIGNDGHNAAGVPSTWLPLAQFNRYSYSKIARLMQRLDALGVLDSTLIYASSDMGNPALHSTRNVPTILAGGAGGRFRMGRHIRLAPDCPPTDEWCAEDIKVNSTNNHLLVSIAQAFGADINAFGTQPDPGLVTGAMTEL